MIASPKATRTEVGLVYLTGLVQGLALVTFPAASSVFTSPHGYGFSSTRYGAMFLPQVVLAILASSLAPKFANRWSLKRVLVLGVLADLVAMALLASSKVLMASPDAAFGLLLIATGCLGFGFGATVMALNTYAEHFFPENSDRAVLALNALLGTGTALAPLFVSILLGLGVWWALPIMVAFALALIVIYVLKEPLQIASSSRAGSSTATAGPSSSCRRASGFMRRLSSCTGFSRHSMGTGRRYTSACSDMSRRRVPRWHSPLFGQWSRSGEYSLLRCPLWCRCDGFT